MVHLWEAEVRDVFELIADERDVGGVVPQDVVGLELLLRLRANRLEPEEGLEELSLGHDGEESFSAAS